MAKPALLPVEIALLPVEIALIQVKDVLLSHPHLYEPDDNQGKFKPRYGANLLIPKATPLGQGAYKEIQHAMIAVAKARHGDKLPTFKRDKKCLRDGDDPELVSEKDTEIYAGHWYVSCARRASDGPVPCYDRDGSPLSAVSGKPYAGCRVYAFISVYIAKNYPDTISAGLDAVKFFKDGQPFGKALVPANKFDEFEDDSEFDGAPTGHQANGRDASASLEI